jgi:formate hydrogenlyase subunit 6/NADH:ubiquinone oxidoreductase subunit I
MPYTITNKCIDCHRCESICPTGAIAQNEQQQYQIDSGRCNDCVGYYSVPQCWAACPTGGGCISSMATLPRSHKAKPANEYWEQWFEIYNSLVSGIKTNQLSDYWQSWFDKYSQTLSQQLQTPTSVGVNS